MKPLIGQQPLSDNMHYLLGPTSILFVCTVICELIKVIYKSLFVQRCSLLWRLRRQCLTGLVATRQANQASAHRVEVWGNPDCKWVTEWPSHHHYQRGKNKKSEKSSAWSIHPSVSALWDLRWCQKLSHAHLCLPPGATRGLAQLQSHCAVALITTGLSLVSYSDPWPLIGSCPYSDKHKPSAEDQRLLLWGWRKLDRWLQHPSSCYYNTKLFANRHTVNFIIISVRGNSFRGGQTGWPRLQTWLDEQWWKCFIKSYAMLWMRQLSGVRHCDGNGPCPPGN